MSKKIYSIINNVIFISSLLISLYAFINIYLMRRGLPPGSCPVENYRPWLYLAIALGAVSFIASFFELKKKAGKS